MDSDLLIKEKQFRKMNADLKTKTRHLLQEIETNAVDDFSNSEEELNERDGHSVVVPTSGRCIHTGSEGVIRLLQAKTKLLSDQLTLLKSDYVKRTDEWKCVQGELVKAEESTLKNKQCLLSTHDRLRKQEKLVSTITGHLQIRDRENSILKKQIESLKRELAQKESNSNANEAKLNRNVEETERLKDALKKSQHEEKRLKDLNKTMRDDFNKTISRLEKQKSDLVSSFKKQLFLISILKRQLGILETSNLINVTEEEFSKLLDWTPGFV